MSLTPKMIIDSERAKHAASLYNNIHDMLTEAGWREELEEDHFWPDGKPTGAWRHPRYAGSFSMDAAFVRLAQDMPRRP